MEILGDNFGLSFEEQDELMVEMCSNLIFNFCSISHGPTHILHKNFLGPFVLLVYFILILFFTFVFFLMFDLKDVCLSVNPKEKRFFL